jgi:threonyl-tRNA synthetase
MRILTLHCDYIKFKPLKKAIGKPEELSEERKKEINVKDPLVVLTAVEEGDNEEVVKQLCDAVTKTAEEVKATSVVLYPYAHLSSNLSKPDVALAYLTQAESILSKKFSVVRAPFGYYKEFELKVKGHPMSELSKEFRATGSQPAVPVKAKSSKLSNDEVYDPIKLLHALGSTKLDTSKLEENDHRIIGQKLNLFMFNETAPGMPYWLPAGLIVYNELLNFWRIEHAKEGYQETATPLMNKSELYKISGHWEHYKQNMFIAETDEDEKYCLKPMNCPNAMIIFKSRQRSYKDLPLRFSDADRLHRFERSGTLNGLFRVRGFQQDDSHNFITEDMIETEYKNIFRICEKFYSLFGMDYAFRLGTRPKEGFLGDIASWDKAESILKNILKSSGKKFAIAEGDGAFYGPKIDILMKDSMGREWQTGTIQLDFQLPKRFELVYTDKEGKEKTPIVVHRVIYGSLERFIGVLLEHLNGTLPLWLSPVQVKVLSFTDRNNKAVEKLVAELKEAIPAIRVEADIRDTTVNDKIRDSSMMKVPFSIVLGDKEEENKTLAVRTRDNKVKYGVKLEDFVKELKESIEKRN